MYGNANQELNCFRECNKASRQYKYFCVFAVGIIAYESIMGYYIRVLGKKLDNIPLEELRQVSRPAVLHTEENGDAWKQLILSHKSGQEIAVIEKNPVVEGQLGADELQEFIAEISDNRPESAATWLQQYLPSVKVVYAFQLLNGTDVEDGWIPLRRLYNAVWKHAGGILQADGEGFSDEGGYTILWQFSESVTGKWNMGVLRDGRWIHFEMDLGSDQHRKAFLSGQLPDGAKVI
jgi:hypothetical protein